MKKKKLKLDKKTIDGKITMAKVVFLADFRNEIENIISQLSKKDMNGDLWDVIHKDDFSIEKYDGSWIVIDGVRQNKEYGLLIDMGGNLKVHGGLGAPYTEKQKKADKDSRGRVCPDCEEYVQPPTARECPSCGFTFPEPEVRKAGHEYEPNTSGQAVHSDICGYDVHGVRYREHTSKKSGKTSLMVSYDCDYGKYGNIAEWVSVHHDVDSVRARAKKWFADRGNPIGDPKEYSMDDLLWHAEHLKKPARIIVDHAGEFPRIVRYEWEKSKNESELDDEIRY